MSTAPAYASASQALQAACAALRFAAAADPAAMPDAAKAACLHGYEQAGAMLTAGRARTLGSFTASQGYAADAEYSAGAWLRHQTRVTKTAARGQVAWARRAVAHPRVIAALAEGSVLSESVGRAVCCWSDRLPEGCREAADQILVTAARAGADEWDLAGLAAEMYARSLPPGQGPEDGFGDRSVRLETTFDGAGVIAGELDAGVCGAGRRGAGQLCRPRRVRRIPGPMSSVIMTGCRRRCGGWRPVTCCRSGPGSRSRPWCT